MAEEGEAHIEPLRFHEIFYLKVIAGFDAPLVTGARGYSTGRLAMDDKKYWSGISLINELVLSAGKGWSHISATWSQHGGGSG